MSALFDFQSFLTVVLLTICTCTFIKASWPKVLSERTGYVQGLGWVEAAAHMCTVAASGIRHGATWVQLGMCPARSAGAVR